MSNLGDDMIKQAITSVTKENDVVFHIQNELDNMPKTYQKIAYYVINNFESISNLSITQLAMKTGTYSSAITRFCQSLGYSGFPEFKFNAEKKFLLSVSETENLERNDSSSIIKQKLLPRHLQAVEKTVNILNPDDLDRISNIMAHAKKIYFFGHGGSGTIANLGQILFMQIGMPAVAFTEISTSAMAAAQLQRGDIAFGISSSGCAKTPVDALRVAKSKGATTVGITGFANSHIAYYSNILLCYNLGVEDIRLMHISRMCESVILGILQNCVLSQNYDCMNKNLQTAKDAFMGARYT